MSKTLEEIADTKAGSAEDSRQVNKGGWYELTTDEGKVIRLLAVNHPKFGSAQADAYIRLGFNWKEPATEKDLEGVEFIDDRQVHSTGHAMPRHGDTVPRAEFEALMNRLASVESELSGQRGKASNTGEESTVVEKPLEKMNHAELAAYIQAEGLELEIPDGASKAQIVELIKAAQPAE